MYCHCPRWALALWSRLMMADVGKTIQKPLLTKSTNSLVNKSGILLFSYTTHTCLQSHPLYCQPTKMVLYDSGENMIVVLVEALQCHPSAATTPSAERKKSLQIKSYSLLSHCECQPILLVRSLVAKHDPRGGCCRCSFTGRPRFLSWSPQVFSWRPGVNQCS